MKLTQKLSGGIDHTKGLTRRRWLEATLTAVAGSALPGCGGHDESASAPTTASPASRTDPSTPQEASSWATRQGLAGAAVGAVDASTLPANAMVAAAGLRRQNATMPLQTSDDWYIGSTSKAMTAMVIARLVAQGLLSWESTAAQLLPEAAGTQRPVYTQITLRQWLDHLGGVLALNGQAGDEERFLNDLLADTAPLPQTSHGRRLYACRWVLAQAPQANITPGVDFAYSNAGYMIAATMAEAATGLDFEALLQRELLQPLGLAVNWRMPSERSPQAVVGHDGPLGHLTIRAVEDAQIETWQQSLAPAGAWATTPDSYARWVQTVLLAMMGQATPLPAEAVDRLRQLQIGQYALGWYAVPFKGGTALWHNGSLEGCMSEVVVHATARWAGFGMSNTAFLDETTGQSWVHDVLLQAVVYLAK